MTEQEPDQSEIAQHLPYLEHAAAQSAVILELGTGHGNGSTRYLSRGIVRSRAKDKMYLSVDCDPNKPDLKPDLPYWSLILGNSIDPDTAEIVKGLLDGRVPDLIFIDTNHTYEHMKAELSIWGPLADKRTTWVFHDTWMSGTYNPMTDAIKEYVRDHPGWKYVDVSMESHGLGQMSWLGQ